MPLIAVVGAYLIGSISAAILVCRLLGHADPRSVGSNNPGATNVLRFAGKTAAALTLIGDSAKGLVPVLIGKGLGLPDFVIAAMGIAALLGHVFPVFFQFKGGKGVATLIGVLLGYHLLLGLAFVLVWLAVAAIFRYSSLAALSAAAAMPVVSFALGFRHEYTAAIVAMVAVLLWRHRTNIRNLLAGTESKIGHKA